MTGLFPGKKTHGNKPPPHFWNGPAISARVCEPVLLPRAGVIRDWIVGTRMFSDPEDRRHNAQSPRIPPRFAANRTNPTAQSRVFGPNTPARRRLCRRLGFLFSLHHEQAAFP